MSEEVGALHYTLTIDDGKISGQLADNAKVVEEFGGKVSDTGDKIAHGMKVAGAGIAVAGAGITLYAKNATDATVQMVKDAKNLGREIGVSTEEASRLTQAFKRMGVDANEAQQMFGIFSKQIVASTENAGKSADAFSKLGISTRDAQGHQKDFNTILFETADKFQKLPAGVDQTALAMELFGRSGKEMIKVLDLGSAGIKDLEKKADELGLTLNANTIDKVQKLVASQKDLKDSQDALKIQIGTETAPVIAEFNKKINEMLTGLLESDGAVKDLTVTMLAFGGPALTGFGTFIGMLASLAQLGVLGVVAGFAVVALAIVGVGIAIAEAIVHFQELGNFMNQLTDFFTHDWGLAIGIALAVLFPFIGIPALIYANWTGIQSFFVNMWHGIVSAWQWAVAFIQVTGGDVINWFKALPSKILNGIGNLAGSLYNAGRDIIQGMINGVTSKIESLINTVKNAGKRAIDSAKNILGIHSPSTVFEGIGRNVTEGFVKGINKTQGMAIDAMNNIGASVSAPDLRINADGSASSGATTNNQQQTIFNIGQVNNSQDESMVLRRFDRDAKLERGGMSPL